MKKTQKFGIRKHKFGAASVLLGIMVFIGIGHHHEAEAAEDVRKQNTIGNRNEDNSEIDENTTEQVNIEQEQNQDLKLQAENQQSQSEKQTEVNAVSAQPFKTAVQEQVPSNTTVEASERKSEEVGEGKPATQNQTAPQSLTAPTTPKSAETQTSTSPQVRATTYNNTQQGQDVTNKVEVTKSSIEVPNGNNTINPHNAERVTLNYEWKFKNGIKPNDYFDFTISDNVDTKGVSKIGKVPMIKDSEAIIATGQILNETTIRYTFSNYVDNKQELNAQLSLNLFIRPDKVTNAGSQTIISKLGDKETTQSFNVVYLPGVSDRNGVKVNGRIYELDKDNKTFKHLAYINPDKASVKSVTIYGNLTQGKPSNQYTPNVKVYKFKGQGKLAESVYADLKDESIFEDVTSNVNLKTSGGGSYTLEFPDLTNSAYLVDYESKYETNNSDLNLRTILNGYNNYNYYYGYYPHTTLTWDNGVAFYSNKANGAGKNRPLEPIIQSSTPIDLDMNTSPEPERYEAKGVLEESEDSKPIVFESQSGQNFGDGGYDYTETVEDSNPIEISESTHENSEHHSDVVEFEEETNPGGSESQHISNVVEYDEDTAKGIVIGAVTDHTTVEDTKEYTTENNLVELEDTLNPNVSGQAEGPIEEITEKDDYNEMSGLGIESGDSGYTETEEIDENHFIDTNSQLGTENGTNSDNQTFEEDTEDDKPVYQIGSSQEIVEDTTLASESGMNSGNQTFEEDTDEDKPVYQIGSSQEIVEDTTLPNESGMNSDNQTFEEDTEEDKDVIQQGGHSPVDITEDTQPQISGQHQGEQTFEEDTVTPDQPQPPVDREFTPQDNVPPIPPTDEEISPKDPEMLTPPVNEETQPNQPESPTPQEDKEINPNQPHPSSPPMENITANDPKTPVAPKDSETVPSVSKQTTMTSGQAKKTNQSEAMVQTENQKSQINQAVDAKENQHSTTDEKALPNTGQGQANQIPVVLGTMIGVFGLLLLRRRKNNHHTK
ncbi:YSIRK-type signal peptide-containing protein [Staphylococcus coagulans]|uniref:fibrinogen-binding adhesin SdrG C-terminal domain-containing protein n=1 Tax=Staphylococcus coagulans TaxID=74706 RepID=UPI001BEBD5CD|nr:fibrinogen-binding adhesin SdrG C-terminal domain-containing protein [Staphylococcus coagulans]MBT2813622.1 YSIRK-type signal peptide-containing protein [Staphylococcus coagulans]MBT2815885.1 YSIRK-type signal peptide-containing protein [Staphylococcus coagulans]MBT2836726.1 YSIRK-type signal peptide-containing protein [Staphylococcus coagulans]MBT2841254.1 YSIRK-type signal peptide-containing protein [Staphylococcus coagulans]MBT2847847.1 YSIRK-type signal peptide-containing protein [Staph